MQCGTSEVNFLAVWTATMIISAYCRNAVESSVSAKNQCILQFPPRDGVTLRCFPNVVSGRSQERTGCRLVVCGEMLVFEQQQHWPKAREIQRAQNFVVVALRVDHEQIDPRDAMPRQQSLEPHRGNALFDQERLNLRNGRAVFEKHLAIQCRQLAEPLRRLTGHSAQTINGRFSI